MRTDWLGGSGRIAALVVFTALAVVVSGCSGRGVKEDDPEMVPLSGIVLLSTGEAPAVAHVVLEEPGGSHPEELAVGAGGAFEVAVPADTALQLRLAAPDHEELVVPVCLASGSGPATVTVTLTPNPRPETFEEVRIIGDFNGFSFSSAETMTRQDDGTWSWDREGIEGDRLAYQLLGISTNGHSVNGTQNDSYEYDGGGDFRSVVAVKDGAVHIVFDPSKLPPIPEGEVAQVRWDEGHSDLTDLFRVQRLQAAVQKTAYAAWKAHEVASSGEPFRYDWKPWLEQLEAIAGPHPETLAQKVALLATVALPLQRPEGRDPEKARGLLKAVPPSSPAWGYAIPALQLLRTMMDEEEGEGVLERFLTESPVEAVRTEALMGLTLIAQASGDEATWRERFAMLKERVGDSREWKYQLASLDPDTKIRTGSPVPEFTVTLLDGSTFTSKDLAGHYTLIDFWATWCSPCVGEMPHLHEAWKKYHDKGFQILSLSLDRSPDDIAKFRKKWPMPWRHAFMEKGFKNPVVESFEVVGIPTPVLIGPDGTIVATEPVTRGEQLIAILDGLYTKR